ncbi:MAG: glycoside hydrolase family 9 protein [Bacteroidales bacterium]|nr:glycoside hydrolase family 9 protein [Bacteroidales bacterium]
MTFILKFIKKLSVLCLLSSIYISSYSQTGSIRINQLGYYPDATKIAVVIFCDSTKFEIINTSDNSVEFTGDMSAKKYWSDAGDSVKLCDFSALTTAGNYKIRIPGFGESYAFDISTTVLRKAAYASLKSYYYQRSSYELTSDYAGLWARPEGHPDTACILHSSTGKSGKISSPGGWYDAGDYGKYVINAGISVATMLSFYENFNNYFEDGSIHIPESGNGKNDLLDEVKFELDWLKTMQDTDGGVFFKLTTLQFSGFVMPDKDKASRYVIGKTSASALDFAAMMAMAGRIYQDYDTDYANDCIARAESAWTWANTNPLSYFKNPSDVGTGEYGDSNVSDEFIWAAAELYITTQKAEYKTYLEGKISSLTYTGAPGWPSVQSLASLSLATRPNGLASNVIANIQSSIASKCDSWLTQINASPCRIPQFGYGWGSNSGIANIGVGMLYAYILKNDMKYIKGAAECADYLLGKNGTGFSFVSGYGSKTPMNFHHRPSYADGITQPVPGFVSGGPNPGQQDGEVYPFTNPAKCFVDVYGSYASNEVCINWNSPLTALLAGVDAVLGDNSAVDFEVPLTANNPPNVSITAPLYNSKTGSDSPMLVKGTVSDPDGIESIQLNIDSRVYATSTTSPYEFPLDNLPFGQHSATVLAIDNTGLAYDKTVVFNYYPVSPVPGKIEAENYSNMNGVTIQTTTDEGGGLNVSGINTGDYIDLSLNVQDEGDYIIELRVASSSGGGICEVRKITQVLLCSVNIAGTGGLQKWQTVSGTLNLLSGKQTIRLYAAAGGWNLNWINLVYIGPTSVNKNLTGLSSSSLSVMPNPVSDNFIIYYNLPKLAPTRLQLVDIKGRLIETKEILNPQSFSGEFSWRSKKSLKPGQYFLTLYQGGEKLGSCKIISSNQ